MFQELQAKWKEFCQEIDKNPYTKPDPKTLVQEKKFKDFPTFMKWLETKQS